MKSTNQEELVPLCTTIGYPGSYRVGLTPLYWAGGPIWLCGKAGIKIYQLIQHIISAIRLADIVEDPIPQLQFIMDLQAGCNS
jgi:hypothetical protein